MLAKSLEKMGVSYRLWRWAWVILYLLFDVGYGFVVICFTKRTLACEQALHWGFGEGGSEKSRESSTLARSLAIRGEFASRLNELE